MKNLDKVKDAVREFAKEHLDELLEQLLEGYHGGVAHYSDKFDESWSHETAESAFTYGNAEDHIAILRELSDYEETDSGLWEGLEGWEEQLQAVAFWTYRNALEGLFHKLAEDINDEALDSSSDLGALIAEEEEEGDATFDDIFAIGVVNDVPRHLGAMIRGLSEDNENKLLLSQCGDGLEEEGRVELATAVRQRLRRLERSAAVKAALEQFIAGWNSMK